jgi:hypothetical protein
MSIGIPGTTSMLETAGAKETASHARKGTNEGREQKEIRKRLKISKYTSKNSKIS